MSLLKRKAKKLIEIRLDDVMIFHNNFRTIMGDKKGKGGLESPSKE